MTRFFLGLVALGVSVNAFGYGETWSRNVLGRAPVLAGYEGVKASYVCRASGIVGKLIASDKKCYFGYYGVEKAYTTYEVLQDAPRRMRWVYMNHAQDSKLVEGGYENGHGLWICRVQTAQNGTVAGKLVAGEEPTYIVRGGKCYYGLYGKEYVSTTFDVLSY